MATISFTHQPFTAAQMAERLAETGFFTWHGNYYALNFTETMGLGNWMECCEWGCCITIRWRKWRGCWKRCEVCARNDLSHCN